MTRYLIAAALFILAGYGFVEVRPLALGPSLSVSGVTPAPEAPDIVTVAGHVYRTVALTLDGAAVLPQEDGSFSSTFALPSGGSILTLTATDRFGRTVTRTHTVFIP